MNTAVFDPTRTHRFALYRSWAPSMGTVAFIGLNPSTADENVDDNTVRRCINYTSAWGYGKLVMLNLFSLRSTDPKGLRCATPNLPENDQHIISECQKAKLVVAAWGVHGSYLKRDEEVLNLLDMNVVCLGLSKKGYPRHPLYMRKDQQPLEYRGEVVLKSKQEVLW